MPEVRGGSAGQHGEEPGGLAVDALASRPWDYPGARAPYTGALDGGRYRPLTSSDAAALGRRQVVVAVGANASPSVVRRKLEAGGVSSPAFFVHGTITGLGVGHSAHVSRGGYVAATPVRAAADKGRPVVALLLDEEQLACLDLTEPNYDRVSAGTCRLGLEGAVAADGFSVYVSRWGALHEADGRHLDLTTQAEVFEWLGRRCPAVGRLLSRWEGLPATMLALAHDPALRVQVRDLLREHGCAGPTGFEPFVHGAAAEGSPGGEAAPPP